VDAVERTPLVLDDRDEPPYVIVADRHDHPPPRTLAA
jgi:hypothetical protein